jgi:hypothetical protein
MQKQEFFVNSRFRYSLFAALALLVGCSSNFTVDVQPANSHQTLEANFTRAYFAPSESSEDRVVLLSDPIDDPTDTTHGGPLQRDTDPPLYNVLLVQLHWRIASPAKADSLVAHNAVLHWYVYGKPTGTGIGILHYVGTGQVVINTDSTGADVSITRAELQLADQNGSLRDPFQKMEIKSHFHAVLNPGLLNRALDDVNQAMTEAAKNARSAATQPGG